MWALGSPPKAVEQPQKILLRVSELGVHLEADDHLEVGERHHATSGGAGNGASRCPLVGARPARSSVASSKGRPDELQPDRQAGRGVQPQGTESAGSAGQVGR